MPPKFTFERTGGEPGRYAVMEDDDVTEPTLEATPEPPPEELTHDDVIDERPIVTLH